MKNSFSAVFYAINGTGFGHLSRLWAIAKALRTLADALQIRHDIQFLTTSDADFAVRDFPVWKLPSKTVMQADVRKYVAKAKMITANLLAELKPDILVLDTQPEGAFAEFFFVKDFADLNVFIDRKKDEKFSQSDLHLAHLKLYHLILVPDVPENAEFYPLPEELLLRRKFTEVIHRFDTQTLFDRKRLRLYFDIPDDKICIYVSAGGGGDKNAAEEIAFFVNALDPEKYFILAGYGALYAGEKIYRRNVVPLTETDSSRYFVGIDLAISAGGYNSFNELLAARVPTLFYAQKKGMDRQDERILTGEIEGKNLRLETFDAEEVKRKTAFLYQNREFFIGNMSKNPVPQGALTAAYEILALWLSRQGLPIERPKAAYELLKNGFAPTEIFPLVFRIADIFANAALQIGERQNFWTELQEKKNDIAEKFLHLAYTVKAAIASKKCDEKEAFALLDKIFSDRKFSVINNVKTDFASAFFEDFLPKFPHSPAMLFSLLLLRLPKNNFCATLALLREVLLAEKFIHAENFLGTFFVNADVINSEFLQKLLTHD